jgi:citrate synthase
MQPNKLLYRGYRSEELIGRVSYGEMVYLLVRGELPGAAIGRLVDAILVAGCDHGALSPAVAAARMAATCGIPINCAIATGINLLGDIHGGAAEGCMALLYAIRERHGTRGSTLRWMRQRRGRRVARARPLSTGLWPSAAQRRSRAAPVRARRRCCGAEAISGQFLEIARLVGASWPP